MYLVFLNVEDDLPARWGWLARRRRFSPEQHTESHRPVRSREGRGPSQSQCGRRSQTPAEYYWQSFRVNYEGLNLKFHGAKNHTLKIKIKIKSTERQHT